MVEHFPNAIACPGGFWEITVDDMKQLPEGVRQIDVREASELVGDMGLLPGVDHVPLGLVPREFRAWNPEEPLVIICRSGGRSARAALWLQQQGFTQVVSVRGGMLDWNGYC